MNCNYTRLFRRVLFWALATSPAVAYVACVSYGLLPSYSDAFATSSGIGNFIVACLVACSAVNYAVSLLGMLLCGVPRLQNERNVKLLGEQGWSSDKTLIFSFVSQGIQQKVLKHSVSEAIRVAQRHGVRFQVEVVVDTEIPSDPFFVEYGCEVISVPPWFVTPRGSRFKARALYYATLERKARNANCENTWVVHCDEDTVLTDAAIAGIWKFIERPDSRSACGAGEIKYNLTPLVSSNLFSVADYHRTGEDLGRFRFQYSAFKAALFGAHGSFLVVPAQIEEQVQFDFGPQGSIAEDIYFAFRLREMSVPCNWIEGYVREQSPQNLRNFLTQRARWINGLLNSCMDPRIPLVNRLLLLSYLAILRVTVIVGIVPLLFLFVTGFDACLLSLWSLASMVIGTNLLVGTVRNAEEDCHGRSFKTLISIVGVLFVMPIVCFLETTAVVYGLLFRSDEFLVVQKANIFEVRAHAG